MYNKLIILFGAILTASLLSCNKEESGKGSDSDKALQGVELLNRCSYDKVTLKFTVNGAGIYSITDNPHTTELNRTTKCGCYVSGGQKWTSLVSEKLPRKLDFTKNKAVFTLDVFAPKSGSRIIMRLSGSGSDKPQPIDANAYTKKTAEWERLVFDFSDRDPEDNRFQIITLFFDAGEETSGDEWYFDNLCCPDDDLTEICLFQRNPSNPIFKPDGTNSWRGDHMANAGILTPDNSPDGNWWIYLRGSGSCPIYCDQIGLYQQSATNFKPFGPWTEYKNNPVLPIGPEGSFDCGYLLDTAPVVGKDGVVYVYYNGQPANHASHGLCVRYSTDGGYTFTGIDAPLLKGKGCSDAVYHDGKYYIYYGGGSPCRLYVNVTDDPLSFKNAQTYETIPIGGGPSNFDSYAVNGSMVFRVKGVDKWFCSYQGSSNIYDFPDRFHVAMSDDLIHWTKVDNDQPLFTRGSAGEWDQGAIWFCEIFEYQDKMYLYYEGWGREGYVNNRDEAYFLGRSCIGGASCTKEDFLKWCGLQ